MEVFVFFCDTRYFISYNVYFWLCLKKLLRESDSLAGELVPAWKYFGIFCFTIWNANDLNDAFWTVLSLLKWIGFWSDLLTEVELDWSDHVGYPELLVSLFVLWLKCCWIANGWEWINELHDVTETSEKSWFLPPMNAQQTLGFLGVSV